MKRDPDPERDILLAIETYDGKSAPGYADQRRRSARLTDVLSQIADHKITRLDELMPWRYAAEAA